MLLLVTGASGVGKSSARRRVASVLGDRVRAVELCDVADVTETIDEAWRQRAVDAAVDLAVREQTAGRHLLLCGDPVPPTEVFAAPAVDRIEAGAVLLLDASPEVQTARLTRRGDDLSVLHHHHAFQEQFRREAEGHTLAHGWTFASVSTDERTEDEVAHEVLAWALDALDHDDAPPARGASGAPRIPPRGA